MSAITTSASSMPKPSALPEHWIAKLFDRFEAFYGDLWVTRYGGSDLAKVRRIWGEELADLSGEEIALGVKACRGAKFPPTLPEFRQLCRPPIDFEQAYAEAVEQMRLREDGKDRWSHPSVFWAAVTIGSFDLRNCAWKVVEARWRKVLQAELDKGEWQPIPPRAVALPPPPESKATREAIEAKVASLRNLNPCGDREWVLRLKAREADGEKLFPIQTRLLRELEAEAA